MANKNVPARSSSPAALLSALLAAASTALAGYGSYKTSQLTPKVDQLTAELQQTKAQVERLNNTAVDEARKRELFRRLIEKGDRAEAIRVFREVFPEDKIWTDEAAPQAGMSESPR
jgi:outer membrane murein-binding lipoprotein Lpp